MERYGGRRAHDGRILRRDESWEGNDDHQTNIQAAHHEGYSDQLACLGINVVPYSLLQTGAWRTAWNWLHGGWRRRRYE